MFKILLSSEECFDNDLLEDYDKLPRISSNSYQNVLKILKVW